MCSTDGGPFCSAHALPEGYRKLMTDPNSPIIDFYPSGMYLLLVDKLHASAKFLLDGIVNVFFNLHTQTLKLIWMANATPGRY